MQKVQIYCDGACLGNPGRGGWGAVILYPHTRQELLGASPEPLTTNQRMELLAACEALESLPKGCCVEVFTDSMYVVRGMTTGFAYEKKAKQMTRTSPKSRPNLDLWERLKAVARDHEITWTWVRGHAGNVENERADELANSVFLDKSAA